MMALSKQYIPDDMELIFHMDGNVNGHYFTIVATGKAKPYEGKQNLKATVTKGAPLPFSTDILSTVMHYGNRGIVHYPPGIPDYFKQSFPEGYSWERTMAFEDGGFGTVSADIKLKDNTFIHTSMFHGTNFPADGPVMQRKTIQWEKSIEKMTVSDGIVKGDITMFLLLEGGGKYRAQFHTSYKAKKVVEMPQSHYVEHSIERTNDDGTQFELNEHAVARLNEI
uniref:F97M variant of the biphotochromic fluorescent protein moxSAASoti n=1 Tax=Stylocoeniella armata TaxID=1917266 RepID=UPI0032D6DB8D